MSVGLLSVSATDPDCLSGIARAVAGAAAGDTIVVRPGVYREDVVFSADLSVIAEDGPGTVVIETSDGILVTSGRVQLRDIEVRGGHPQLPAIQVTGGTLRLERCDVRAAGIAAVHLLAGELLVHGGSVSNLEGAGLVIEAGSAEIVECTVPDVAGTAVVVSGAARPLFRACTFRDVGGPGVLALDRSAARFEDCRLERIAGPALVVQDAAHPHFQDVVVDQSQIGLYAAGQAAPTLTSCWLGGSRAHGVVITDSAAPELLECTVDDAAGHGVHAGEAAAGRLTRCRVLRTGAAGVVLEDGVTTLFTGAESVPTQSADPDPVRAALAELDELVGLEPVKQEFGTLVGLHRLAERRARAGLLAPPVSRHLVLTGPPGSGKTTVAGHYGRVLAAAGLLTPGEPVRLRLADLLADPSRAALTMRTAVGGMLLIHQPSPPETSRDRSGYRAAADLLAVTMAEHGDDLVVVFCAAGAEAHAFLAGNAALESWFGRTLELPGLAGDDLVTVVERLGRRHGYRLEPSAREAIRQRFAAMARTGTFAHARTAREVFEQMLRRQAYRLAGRPDVAELELACLRSEDLP